MTAEKMVMWWLLYDNHEYSDSVPMIIVKRFFSGDYYVFPGNQSKVNAYRVFHLWPCSLYIGHTFSRKIPCQSVRSGYQNDHISQLKVQKSLELLNGYARQFVHTWIRSIWQNLRFWDEYNGNSFQLLFLSPLSHAMLLLFCIDLQELGGSLQIFGTLCPHLLVIGCALCIGKKKEGRWFFKLLLSCSWACILLFKLAQSNLWQFDNFN